MSSPKVTLLNYTYKKPDTDVFVLNTNDIPIDKTKIKDQQIIIIGPGAIGGNHSHPRTEWFVALGELELIWLDSDGLQQTLDMYSGQQPKLIEIPPFLPHAVINRSQTQSSTLYEWADQKAVEPEPVKII